MQKKIKKKYWEKPETKYYYLYDANGNKIIQREFSVQVEK